MTIAVMNAILYLQIFRHQSCVIFIEYKLTSVFLKIFSLIDLFSQDTEMMGLIVMDVSGSESMLNYHYDLEVP